MDHYYVAQMKILYVRIDSDTLDNSVLNEWWACLGKVDQFLSVLDYTLEIRIAAN